ncbi:hypothetical protein B0O99DRAFT_588725 [Bisporella sp. PMI_857]|nr:hypothetical protein B0O99DRAFT_588725 [Bisporella sp. PMI_857]
MATGPLAEILLRNSKLAEEYQAQPDLMDIIDQMRTSGAGVIIYAAIIRNAGGRAMDAIRTLAVLQTVAAAGTIAVIHHTDCGLTHFHDEQIKAALTELAPDEKSSIEAMKFGEIKGTIEDSIREDLAILRDSPLIKKTTQIVGLKLDIKTGILTEVRHAEETL